MISHIAHEKLTECIYMNLPCVESYLHVAGIEFSLASIEKKILSIPYDSSDGRRQEIILAVNDLLSEIKIKDVSQKEKRSMAICIINIVFTRIIAPADRNKTAEHYVKIMEIIRNRDQSDDFFNFMWGKLIGRYDHIIAEGRSPNAPIAKNIFNNSYAYWSSQ